MTSCYLCGNQYGGCSECNPLFSLTSETENQFVTDMKACKKCGKNVYGLHVCEPEARENEEEIQSIFKNPRDFKFNGNDNHKLAIEFAKAHKDLFVEWLFEMGG